MAITRVILILSVMLTSASCGSSGARPAEESKPVSVLAADAPAAASPMILQVVSRDSRIVIRSGADGPTYSMTDQAGQPIAPALTLPQLQANHPDLARRIETMNATTWAGVE